METGWYESVSLSDYLGVVWRRKWIVLLVTLLFTVAAVAYSKSQKPQYSATAQVLAPQVVVNAAGSGNAAAAWAIDHAATAATPTIASLVLGKSYAYPHLGPIKGATTASPTVGPTAVPRRPLQGAVTNSKLAPDTLLAMTTIAADTANPDAIDFTVTTSDPVLAMRLANAWAQGYADFYSRQQGIKTVDKYQQIASSLQTVKDAATKAALLSAQQKLLPGLATPNAPPDTSQAASSNQTAPMTARNTIIGFVLGLLFGLILAFVQDLLDKRIATAAEVGRRLRVPLLAAIPSPPRSLRDHPLVLLAPRGGAQMASAEAYRIAKLNLGNAIRTTHARTIMFTSAGDREGTSTSVANLAVALARAGQHVILVDANMRRPAVDGFFGLDDRAGLSDILAGRVRVADALTALDVSAAHPADPMQNGSGASSGLLEVLPAGSRTDDPADLIDTRAMSELMAELRSRADIVLIDAPPILPVTDAMMIGTKVDAVVAVARSRLASRPHMIALQRALESCAAPALGFLFTGAHLGEEHEYGGLVGVSVVPPPPASRRPEPMRERERLP